MNFFSSGIGDSCTYDDTCFYDESFGDLKPNWFQYPYILEKSGLMNISRLAINDVQYKEYVKNYRLYDPKISIFNPDYPDYDRK
jgi:hypothetical protein